MARPKFRRSLRFENLESRQLLSAGGPTAEEQYMLQLVNAARMNPQAAAEKYTGNLTPDVQSTLAYYQVDLNAVKQAIANSPAKPPLAWNNDLAAAAQGHSQDMANTQVQSHAGSDGSTINSRIQASGYTNASSAGENAYAYATSVDEAMSAFLLDWGVSDQGHRRNLLQANVSSQNAFQSVGIGIVNTGSSNFGPKVITQDFGSQANAQAQLLGVVYSDNQHTTFYAPGEGAANVRIDATNLDTGVNYTTQTMDAGGYQMPLPAGRYQVTASVNNQVVQTVSVNIGTENAEQDFVLTNPWDGRNLQDVIASVTPAPAPPAPAPVNPAPATSASPTSAPAPAPISITIPLSTTSPSPMGSWTSWKANTA